MPSELVALGSPPVERRAKAKAFGVGSAGCNMIAQAMLPRVAFSTSMADIERSGAAERHCISPEKLVGLYQANPAIVGRTMSVAGEALHRSFEGADIAFLMAGLGGASGSLGTAVLGHMARSKGLLSIALVASPFSAESERRREFASASLGRIIGSTDLCVVFGNDALSELAPRLPLSKAFALMNGIMHRQMSDLASVLDGNGVRLLRERAKGAGYGRFGLGIGRGDERVERAVDEAFNSPWFDFDLEKAAGAIAVYSAADPWEREEEKLLEVVKGRLGDARILHGSYRDAGLGDRIRLSLLLMRQP